MSSIKTTQLDGDVSIGRNVAIGGKFTGQGSAHVKGNLTVDGWLDAKNVKGPNKGVFTSVEKLRTAYPTPHDGWWAIVGITLPGDIYVGDGGDWVKTGGTGGNPAVDSEQYNEALALLQSDLEVAKTDITANTTAIGALQTTVTTQGNSLNSLQSQVTAAAQTASQAQQTADGAVETASDLQEQIRDLRAEINNGNLARFDGVVASATVAMSSIVDPVRVVWVESAKVFAATKGLLVSGDDTTYYSNWAATSTVAGADCYMNFGRSEPLKDKFYLCGSTVYAWSEDEGNLVPTGIQLGETEGTAYPGHLGRDLRDKTKELTESVAQLQQDITPRLFFNATTLLSLSAASTIQTVRQLIAARSDAADYQVQGVVLTFLGSAGWESWQWAGTEWDSDEGWRKFGGSASVGNCYNVTNDAPLAMGYYTLDTAVAKAWEKGYTTVGIQVTFAIADGSWKTYQYIGADSSEENFKNTLNWLDLAGMSAGDEMFLNVDYLCGSCAVANYYTLEYAISAINNLQAATGITYAKPGLVVTYRTGEYEWETKQFTGNAADFGQSALWVDYGGPGGATEITTSDEPTEGGADAFSTGGAYRNIPADLNVDSTSADGVVKLSLVNAAGEQIGNEHQFTVGTGTGGGGGTIVTVIPEQSPLYGQAGGTMVLNCSIRSITTQGGQETSNLVERVELYDRDTSQLLETLRFNQASSADNETFDFAIDLSAYFTQAGQRKFRLVAYDDSENSGSRNVNVTAVDVTISSVQTLHYTASTALNEGGSTKTLPMYRFANNASDKGILCTTEIWLDGKWQVLGTATISDTYSHSVSINPGDCLGQVLTHGAYPLRIHGVDVASGVVGNYLHTAVMVVGSGNTTPIVVSRWLQETETATVRQYESISMEYAAYSPSAQAVQVEVVESVGATEAVRQTTTAYRNATYGYQQRISGYATDGTATINLYARASGQQSATAQWKVDGTLLDIEPVTSQLMVDIDMEGRSNSDADKSVTYGPYTLAVEGSNYSTNGFVKDSYGTPQYGTESDTGVMALRIAENVKATLDYAPFNRSDIEANGLAIQFRIRVKHVADEEARLISCISGGLGFYVTGANVVFTVDGGATVAHTITSAIKDDSITDVAIVIEPTSQAPYSGIGVAKMYFDGELIGACYYNTGSLQRHATQVTFDGTEGDLYLYNIRAWETYYGYEQSFNNYLLKLSDTGTMIDEYNYNSVMASQSAEGKPATNRPQAAALYGLGIMYFVLCKNPGTADQTDNYPDYLETLDGDKKTSRLYDVYAYFPDRPWQDFKAVAVPTTNQGTTSSMRPIKNIKMKFKNATVTLLHDRSEFSGDDLARYDECAANAAKHRVQPLENSIPTNIITVKVDYSESGGANNGASTQMFNELQRALGSNYMTPAQNAYTGKYTLNTSIDSVPCAFFRTDPYSADATSPSYGYFHAKGNWNDDKGDAAVFGFEDVDGYNAGCLNYGDFIELIAARDQSLDDFNASIDKGPWDTGEVYVLSEFCGPGHKVFRYQDGAWAETTGTMQYTGGKWVVSGDVVNPVENYELRAYNAMDWFQGVKTVDDMLAPTSDNDSTPIWLTYFESRYPDDDDLNQAYEDGRKVPYQLFKWLEWCEHCNQNLTEADGGITIDGDTVSGTAVNRLLKFKRELHKVANVHSMICYHVFTDYIAAVDQRSKNMMVGFYLDTDGVMRMYLNHLYDGDTILGSDNDCGLTIPAELDPNNDPNGYYQGHDSVLFTQLARADYLWLAGYTGEGDTADTTKTVTVASVAATMRSLQLPSGLRPFSPEGIRKYWITDRLQKWPKLVSSYDGIRKYIEHSESNDNYFYALHGLSIQRLEDYVATRFLFRDGYYQCGDTYASAISMRCTGTDMSVTIKAAKRGFFGIGVDQASSARESVYLEAGESATLHSGNTNLGSGVMLYIYGAERIEELDIRNATPKQQGWDISQLTLLKRLVIGGEDYTPATSTDQELSNLVLGQLPFLEELDVRNFPVKTIDASYCPRLKTVLAGGSALASISLAETSPVETVQLPSTLTALELVSLPNLSYPGGLTVEGLAGVQRLMIENCPKIDAAGLIEGVLEGSAIRHVRLPGLNVTAPSATLAALKSRAVIGIDPTGTTYDEENQCSGLTGRWIFTDLVEDSVHSDLQAYFPELTVYNSQYSHIMFDDAEEDTQNITNLDNSTGYAFSNTYAASGHFLKIEASSHAYRCQYDEGSAKMRCKQLSDTTYAQYADGTTIDLTDTSGIGFDIMKHVPAYWYKGVNDYKNQQKHLFVSATEEEPLSTATKVVRRKLSELLHTQYAALQPSSNSVGSAAVMSSNSNHHVYEMDVEGMKQVRFPGVNSNVLCAAFTDSDGIIIELFNMYVPHSQFDFVAGDYIFAAVPQGAAKFLFTAQRDIGDVECIAVDSAEVEAIEPDWVRTSEYLVGVYGGSLDGLNRMRSISGAKTRCGAVSEASTTSPDWTYDSEGNLTNAGVPSSEMNYTCGDLINLCRMRGAGFQSIDYEMSKDIANLVYGLVGDRDIQIQCGYGCGAGYTTGQNSLDTYGNQTRITGGSGTGNLIFGLQNFVGCNGEWQDYVAVNVSSYAEYRARKMVESSTLDTLDAKWHIYDPATKTERTVQGTDTTEGYCIARVRFGRYADIIASKCTTDKNQYSTNYADGQWYNNSRGRVPLRGGHSAYAHAGLAYAVANVASSYASTNYGARLAFRGAIEYEEA